MNIKVKGFVKSGDGHRRKRYAGDHDSPEAAANAIRGFAADRIKLKVRLDTVADFDALIAALPVIRETLNHAPTAARLEPESAPG